MATESGGREDSKGEGRMETETDEACRPDRKWDSLPREPGHTWRASDSRGHSIMSPENAHLAAGCGRNLEVPRQDASCGDLGGKVAPDWTPGSLGPGSLHGH